MPKTRSSLLSRIKNRDDNLSWEEFDQLYRPMLLRYALARGLTREESEEISQQCLVAISAGIQSFQRKISFRAWLRGMVDNKVNEQLRKKRKEVAARTADFQREQATEENPALVWERQWNKTHLLYSLNLVRKEISTTTYQIFDMYVIQEMPVKQICEELGMSPNQVYVAKSRVMARLKKRWAASMEGPA